MSLQSKFNPSAPEFIPGSEPPKRDDSSKRDPNDTHYRFNCASSFQSLTSHLNEVMDTGIPDKSVAILWIENCIRAREIVTANLKERGKPTDKGHEKVIKMLKNLSKFITINVKSDEGAAFGFRENPQRFLIRTYTGKKATIYSHGILFNRLVYGGRKSTRKNRKSKRKTYRILPRVEGS
jgi:hypothetical protein